MSEPTRGLVFELARVTLQFDSPFLVGTGRGDAVHDTQFAATPDGLPVLPGTSIAGLLRHAWARQNKTGSTPTGERADQSPVARAFGYQASDEGTASRVEISFGHIHDASDRPVQFLGANPDGDAVLEAVRRGVIRDHVRLNGQGVVDDRGKFDAWMVPAGARFTFELVVHPGAGVTAQQLIALLASDALRMGGRTRRGLGRFSVVRAASRTFDLRKQADFADFERLSRDLHEAVPKGMLKPVQDLKAATVEGFITAEIELEPESWWMFGGGTPVREDHRKPGTRDFVDRVNAHELRIMWSGPAEGQRASVTPEVNEPDLAPGTALKGALRHRVAFHARRAEKKWTSLVSAKEGPDAEPAVQTLFGSVSGDDATGTTGCLYVDDGRIEGDAPGHLDHVSLDRFTQGPMSGLLFDEAPRFGGTLRFKLTVDKGLRTVDPDHRKALKKALRDLTEGRLEFGATSSRGFGVARRGKVTWSDGGAWLEGRP